MLIVQAGTREFAPMLRENKARCERFGCRVCMCDLGGLGWGEPFDLLPGEMSHPDSDKAFPVSSLFKPRLLSAAMRHAAPDEIVAWIDADAIVIRGIGALDSLDFDVAVTLREPEHVGKSHPYSNYLNAGVVFVRKTEAGCAFLTEWQVLCATIPNDQAALNEAVAPGWTLAQWLSSYGRTHETGGVKIHVLPAAEWNYSDFNRAPGPQARILHFKGGWRKVLGDRWRDYLAA